jgi:hypothetical protein
MRPAPVRATSTPSLADPSTPGIGLSASPLNRLNTEAFAPMPSASTAMTTSE